MKKEVLKNLINQIKKYSLTDAFKTSKDFDNWLSKLNKKQIKIIQEKDKSIYDGMKTEDTKRCPTTI